MFVSTPIDMLNMVLKCAGGQSHGGVKISNDDSAHFFTTLQVMTIPKKGASKEGFTRHLVARNGGLTWGTELN